MLRHITQRVTEWCIKIWGFNGSEDSSQGLLGYDAM